MRQQPRSIISLGSSAKSDSAEVPSTRWWESYLVRYFIGFIVGCCCIVLFGLQSDIFDKLIKYLSTSSLPTGKPDWSAISLLVALLGLGFCYIASTPITVFHAGRYRRGWFEGHSRHFWLSWILLCLIMLIFGVKHMGRSPCCEWFAVFFSGALIFADLSSLCKTRCADMSHENGCTTRRILQLIPGGMSQKANAVGGHYRDLRSRMGSLIKSIEKIPSRIRLLLFTLIWLGLFWGGVGRLFGTIGIGLNESAQKWWILSMPAFWILIGQYTVLFRLLHEKEKFFAFYAKLFKARRMKNARDVRDTYTHLREHSNSIFIVVIELALLALFMAISSSISSYKGIIVFNDDIGTLAVFGFALWMVPTIFMWARANSLEEEFAENPNSYLK